MTPRYNLGSADELFRKANLHERLQDLAWGMLLLVLGTLWLLPANSLPPGTWLVATGLVMLALNVIRYIYGIKMNGFSLFVGVLNTTS